MPNISDLLTTNTANIATNTAAVANSPGAWTLIASVTADSDSYAALSNIFSDTYVYYRIVCTDVFSPDANNSDLHMQITQNTSTWLNLSYRYNIAYTQSSQNEEYTSNTALFYERMGQADNSLQKIHFWMDAFNPHGNTVKVFRFSGAGRTSNDPNTQINPMDAWMTKSDSGTALKGVRFYSSNNISGTFKAYGLALS